MKMKLFYVLIGIAAITLCRAQKKVIPSLRYADQILTVDGIRDTLKIYKNGKLIFREMVHDPPLDIWIRTGQGNYTARIDTLQCDFKIE